VGKLSHGNTLQLELIGTIAAGTVRNPTPSLTRDLC